MASNKIVSIRGKQTNKMLKAVIKYILFAYKIDPKYVAVWGPYFETGITPQAVYEAFMGIKQLFEKRDGRLYYHHIISFHRDEVITPEQIMYIAKTIIKNFFCDFQVVYAVHFDRENLHVHMVINSVNYINGNKYHMSKKEFHALMGFTNEFCCSLGLSLNERGKHFDGSSIKEGAITSWNKKEWKQLQSKKGYLYDCFEAVKAARSESTSKEEFVKIMYAMEWIVHWNRKTNKILFENEDGKKVSNQKLEKTFHANTSADALLKAFTENAIRESEKKRKQAVELAKEENFTFSEEYEEEVER